MSSYLALKLGYINKTNPHIHNVELKTLYVNFVWLLQNRFLLSISRTWKTIKVSAFYAVSQLIMRVRKPKVEYKLALQEKTKGAPWRIIIWTILNNLTRIITRD